MHTSKTSSLCRKKKMCRHLYRSNEVKGRGGLVISSDTFYQAVVTNDSTWVFTCQLHVVGPEVLMAVCHWTPQTRAWHFTAHPHEHVENKALETFIFTAIAWVCALGLRNTHLTLSSSQVHSSLFQRSALEHQGSFYVINLIERWTT